MATYDLRKRKDVSYKVKNDKLYPIEVVEREDNRIKIHYTGYDKKFDEWRDMKDIVQPKSTKKSSVYRPFSLYGELSYQVKLALNSSRRKEPEVRIEIPFDEVEFNGGLKLLRRFYPRAWSLQYL